MSLFLSALLVSAARPAVTSPWEKEVIYQIFPRSFYDSNGDRIGDFNGIREKLGYVKGLGATAILLQPILKSQLYHNYFPDSFFEADPAFGTNREFFDMVRTAHELRLKVILDMELQYVASLHPWFVAAEKHPHARAGKFVLKRSGFYGFTRLPTYDGRKIPIAAVNTRNPAVVACVKKAFLFWSAPPGRPQDGVDGFRLDHMMDDLDNKHENTHMFRRVWQPIEDAVRAVKPKTFFVAEQSDWGLGGDQFRKGKVDAVYAIPLRTAIVSGNAGKIDKALRREQATTPAGKTQLLFVEDHDVERYASVVHSDPALERLGAVLMLTAKGTPSIYYGQELGMKGIQLHGKTDGNDIPVRLAFRWTKDLKSPGTATWYGKGPWANPAFSASNDGISVQEEKHKSGSLLSFYRQLISLRRINAALRAGSMQVLGSGSNGVVCFVRRFGLQTVLVAVNFGRTGRRVTLPKAVVEGTDLWNGDQVVWGKSFSLPGRSFKIVEFQF